MSTSSRLLKYLSLGLLISSLAAEGRAASNRIFMAPNGNNASDCANPVTPCLTFAGAMAQVNPGGEVIAEATGGYGPLNITQAVTISGPTGIVMFSGLQVTVNAPGAAVVLRGLTIDGAGATGNGLMVQAVGNLQVEHCVITGFAGSGTTGNGISFASAGQLSVKDTIIRVNASAGVQLIPPSGIAQASIDHCRLEGNQFGLSSSSFGGGTAIATIAGSVISGNTSTGLVAQWAGAELNAESCMVANNGGTGVLSLGPTTTVRVSNCTVTNNVTGLSFSGSGALLSRSNNTVEGNGTDGTFSSTYTAK